MTEPANIVPIPRQNEQVALIAMIERLARDPSTDLEKLKELLEFKREIMKDVRLEAFNTAYVDLQGKLDPVSMRGVIDIGRGGKNQKYALFEDLHASIRIPMYECGFGLSARVTDPEPGIVAVTTILMHRAGHREETTIRLPYDTSGSKNNVQSRGSSIAYGRRYGAMTILNLAATGDDDDGRAGGGDEAVSPEQLQEIENLVAESGANITKFCEYMGVKTLAEIRASRHKEAVAELRNKVAANKKKAEAAQGHPQ